MCRMLGIVASEATDFRVCLREAPRSLASLSPEHPHGWGLAVFGREARGDHGWTLKKQPACAQEDDRFHEVVVGSRGELLVAHIRKRTVGAVRMENTHPFRRGRWVFAHNGTIDELDWIRANVSAARAAEVTGDTDSELFFAFVLSRLDAAGLGERAEVEDTSAVVTGIVRDLAARAALGACNFLLANGDSMYAYRQGRSLFTLERGPHDRVRSHRESRETGASVDTPWTARRTAVLVASERMTDEPWRELQDRTLLHIARAPVPALRVLAAGA